SSAGVGALMGSSMQFTVAAGTTMRTLHVYAGVQAAAARLNLSLSDSSGGPIQASLSDMNGVTNMRYTITYNAASDGQTLTVRLTATERFGTPNGSFAALLSATLH